MSELHHSDPLIKMPMPDYGRELFKRFENSSEGFSPDAIIFAAINMIIIALRMSYGKRDQVIARIDDLAGRTKDGVLRHYDPVTGVRRSTVPFTQRIAAPLIVDKDAMLNVRPDKKR